MSDYDDFDELPSRRRRRRYLDSEDAWGMADAGDRFDNGTGEDLAQGDYASDFEYSGRYRRRNKSDFYDPESFDDNQESSVSMGRGLPPRRQPSASLDSSSYAINRANRLSRRIAGYTGKSKPESKTPASQPQAGFLGLGWLFDARWSLNAPHSGCMLLLLLGGGILIIGCAVCSALAIGGISNLLGF